MNDLILELKTKIIKSLNLDIAPDEIKNDAPLFGDGLALDSIDALELIVILEDYGIKISDSEEASKAFVSLNTLANYVVENRK